MVQRRLPAELVQALGGGRSLLRQGLAADMVADGGVFGDAVLAQRLLQQSSLHGVGGLAEHVLTGRLQLRQGIVSAEAGIPAGPGQEGIRPGVQDLALPVEELVLQFCRPRGVGQGSFALRRRVEPVAPAAGR